jgi:sulfite reductase (ferredoxin)
MFKLPEEIKKDIENYRHSLQELREGRLSLSRFRGIRVPWGIYSHRGGKVFMNRIRVPAGLVSASQLKILAQASKLYGDGVLHITTRQDIQIHNVKIEDTIKIMDLLKDHDLSPRGGGGNTVRNVIACVLAGVCKEEIFDVRKYALAVTEYLLRQETSYNLPRKFKIAFSSCSRDCAGCLVNDLGLLAQRRDGQEGFKVFVGGGMGAQPRIGKLLEEFIPKADLGFCVAALKSVFYKKGNRRNKHHNRLRFLIEDIGFEEFKGLYKQELRDLKESEHISLRKIDFPGKEALESCIPQAEDKQYQEFLEYNVSSQRQSGYASLQLRIPRGDIAADKLASLADLEEDFPGIEFRTSPNQNIFIVWAKNEDLYRLFLRLREILKEEFLYPQTLLDVVACKGASTCNLGLCNSPGLAKEIEDITKEFIGTRIFKHLDIKLNGCPNACGHQPLGKLSFYGMVRRVDNRPVPFYKFLLGGRKEAQATRLAQEVGVIPARGVPGFLRDFLRKAQGAWLKDCDTYQFLAGPARQIAEELLEKYSYVPSYLEDRTFYIDWGKKEEFSLAGLGPGECGAGIIDMIEADLSEAKIALQEAERKGYSSLEIRKALFLSARALLVVKGSDPKNEQEAFSDFKKKFIDEAIASGDWRDIGEVFAQITQELHPQERKERFNYAQKFLEHINQIYKSMDPSFNFPKQDRKVQESQSQTRVLDLKGTPCPINYVKTKLALEGLNPGDILEVLLDEGEPIENVPKSLQADGHEIITIERQNGFYKVLVRKQ